ncbi:unnamed protein product [Meganyctiphanes norvegica]|uniref:Uncharacterized protein n=1 Tax=Meganyctiphanes norvegica TaxID=48144 RepID=A0AAV2Q6M2_MEGNR
MKGHKTMYNYWRERVDIWKFPDRVYTLKQIQDKVKEDRKFEAGITALVAHKTKNKAAKDKFKRNKEEVRPLINKYEETMPKAKDVMISYMAELNEALMEITEIFTSENETGLVKNVMPNPIKVLCLREASSSEVENSEIPEILMLNVTPKAKTVIFLKENDHERIAEHNEEEKMEEKLDKMVKYNVYEKEKISLIYKWRLLKTERKLFIVQLLLVEQKLEEMDEEDFATVELEYYKKEFEGDEFRKILRGNLEEQCQIQEKCEELDQMINSLSMESDEDKRPKGCEKPTTTEEAKKEVSDQEKSPRTLKGQSYQEKYENIKNEGFKKKVLFKKKPRLKWQNHRKYRKIKSENDLWKNLPDELQKFTLKTAVIIVLIEILFRTTFPFMKGKTINSTATTKETYKDGKFKFKYKTILVSLFCM